MLTFAVCPLMKVSMEWGAECDAFLGMCYGI